MSEADEALRAAREERRQREAEETDRRRYLASARGRCESVLDPLDDFVRRVEDLPPYPEDNVGIRRARRAPGQLGAAVDRIEELLRRPTPEEDRSEVN